MSSKRVQYDVEEKGLNPKEPHNKLGPDGKLLPGVVVELSFSENSEPVIDNNLLDPKEIIEVQLSEQTVELQQPSDVKQTPKNKKITKKQKS